MSRPSRALVVKLSSLGDLFHALPAVHILKRDLNLSLDWVAQPEYVDLVSRFDDVDRVIPFPRRRFFRSLHAWITALRAESYEYVFDFQGLLKSAIATRIARAHRRIGPSYHREGARIFYGEIAGTSDKNRHAVEEALDFVHHFDLTPDDTPCFPVTFPSQSLATPSPRVAYLPCSRWMTKNWPPEHFSALIDAIHERVGGSAYLLGSRDDRSTCDRIDSGTDTDITNLCGETSLVELGGYLQSFDLLITVDSGPMHMASAVGTPVLALFGSTDPRRTGPYGEGHRVVQHGALPCQPCRARVCLRPEKDMACMRDLKPERVADIACDLLAQIGGSG